MAEAGALLIPLLTAGASAGVSAAAAKSAGGKTPKIQAPTPLPAPEDPAALEARRRKQAELAESGGREGTNLATPQRAAPAYSNTVLGGS